MPSVAREYELKFGAGPDFSVSEVITSMGVASIVDLPELNLRANYYDTGDLRLARSGVTLRHRVGEESDAPWTLKFLTREGSARNEISLSGSGIAVPPEASDLVTAYTRGAELVRVAALNTKRRRWLVRDGDGHDLAEVVDDNVVVKDGRRIIQRFRELEVESRASNGQGVKQIAAALTRRGAARLPLIPKVVRALGSRATAPPDIPQPPRVGPGSPASDAVRSALATALQNLILSDPAVRLGEAEGVHRMRVAVRRLRSHLRMFDPVLVPKPAGIIEDLRWLARDLGRVRDLDVLWQRLERLGGDLLPDLQPVADRLAAQHDAAQRSLRLALSSDAYVHVLDTLIQYVDRPGVSSVAYEECRTALPRLAGETYSSLADTVKDLQEKAADDNYHEVRIHAKRMRYAAEAVAGCLGKQAKNDALRLARLAENVQNVLGERQDSVVMRDLLMESTKEKGQDGAFCVSLGRLIERQYQAIRTSDDAFWRAWNELDRKKNRAWLNK